MTKLLVSVRNAVEARDALRGGADLIDFKEPRRGSLAAVEPTTLAEGLAAVAGALPTSAALGELRELEFETLDDLPDALTYAKVGLAGCASWQPWREAWRRATDRLPSTVGSVAVVYADHRTCGAPLPQDVLEQAARLGCRAILVDTFAKRGQSLLDLWSMGEIESLCGDVRGAGMLSVLGGSLDAEGIERLRTIEPDYFAVRGAVTQGDRAGQLDPRLVADLAAIVHAQANQSWSGSRLLSG